LCEIIYISQVHQITRELGELLACDRDKTLAPVTREVPDSIPG